jgi:hypothetical protein
MKTFFFSSLKKKQKRKFLGCLNNCSFHDTALAFLETIVSINNISQLNERTEQKFNPRDESTILSEIFIYFGNHFKSLNENRKSLFYYQKSLSLGNQLANYFIANLIHSENPNDAGTINKIMKLYDRACSIGHYRSAFKLGFSF